MKRLVSLIFVVLFICSCVISASAYPGESGVLNYTLYDSSRYNNPGSGGLIVLAQNGIKVNSGKRFTIFFNYGRFYAVSGTFSSYKSNGSITVIEDDTNLCKDDLVDGFIVTELYDTSNTAKLLVDHPVKLNYGTSPINFVLTGEGKICMSSSMFNNYIDAGKVTVIDTPPETEPATEESTDPEPTTEESTSDVIIEPSTEESTSGIEKEPLEVDSDSTHYLQVIVILISVLIGILLGQAFSFWKW